jgi:hypothetical protein
MNPLSRPATGTPRNGLQLPYAFWADRATTHKLTGHSSFYMAHGVEPVLPPGFTLATFLVPDLTDKVSTADLIATRARQL